MLRVQEPKQFLSGSSRDNSRLGFLVEKLSIKRCSQVKHGIVLLGIPDDRAIKNTGGIQGASQAPDHIRTKLFRMVSPNIHFPVYDLGNVVLTNSIKGTHERVEKILKLVRSAGHLPVVFGGGHDLVFPEAKSMIDSTRSTCGFLNIDAHLDLRNTAKGISSGSPWYLLLEKSAFHQRKCTLTEFGVQEHCNAPDLREYAEKNKIRIVWLDTIRSKNESVEKQFQKELLGLSKANEHILVSLDIDAIKGSDAPGCSAIQTLGFSAEEATAMSFQSGKQVKVDSFGIYEVSPPLDTRDRTSALAAFCVYRFLQGYALRKKR